MATTNPHNHSNPARADLTLQQTADFLKVSCSYLAKQLETGAIPFHKLGRHYRIRSVDLMAYKDRIDRGSREAMDLLTAQAQQQNLGY